MFRLYSKKTEHLCGEHGLFQSHVYLLIYKHLYQRDTPGVTYAAINIPAIVLFW